MARKSPETSQSLSKRRSTRKSILKKNSDEDFNPPALSSSKRSSTNDHISDDAPTAGTTPNTQEVTATLRRTSRRAATKTNEERPKVLAPGQSSLDYALQQVTLNELQRWKGWCEVESDPAFFNVMLREAGVTDLKIQEIFSLEEDMLMYLPKPIHGLIFLFRYSEDDNDEQELDCPENVWFANQVSSNACATVALLNMVMNIDNVRLGEELKNFKGFTENMTPPERGQVIDNFEFVRNIHNSFARKMDILNADLFLANEAAAAESQVKGKKGRNKGRMIDKDEPGFHFIAFVPVKGHLWKLDGLQRQPTNLGEVDQNWMELARPMIAERMSQCDDYSISFSLQAVCRNPLLSLPEDLAMNIASLKTTESRLDFLMPEWKQFSPDEQEPSFENTLRAANFSYNLTTEMLDSAQPQSSVQLQLEDPKITVETLMKVRKDLINGQTALRSSFMEEIAEIEEDAQRAYGRRYDYTPFIATWAKVLAEKGKLKDLWKTANE